MSSYYAKTEQPGKAYLNDHEERIQMLQPGSSRMEIVPTPPGTALQWTPRSHPIPNCPPGLEYLTQIDALKMEQMVSLVEAFIDCEKNNKYVVKNKADQQVFNITEDTGTCMRICCGPQRSFMIHVNDNTNQEVMRFTREFKFCAGCCWCAGVCDCCTHEIITEAPAGNVIGSVRQTCSCWKPEYNVLDASRNPVLRILGPCCLWDGPCCSCDSSFKVQAMNQEIQIGELAKQYAGFVRECFTDADKFRASFPEDLDVKIKATLLSALILIDFMFFERNRNAYVVFALACLARLSEVAVQS